MTKRKPHDLVVLDTPDGPVLRDETAGEDYPFVTRAAVDLAVAGQAKVLAHLVGSPSKLGAYDEPVAQPTGESHKGDSVLLLATNIVRARRALNQSVALNGPDAPRTAAAAEVLERLDRQGRRLMLD